MLAYTFSWAVPFLSNAIWLIVCVHFAFFFVVVIVAIVCPLRRYGLLSSFLFLLMLCQCAISFSSHRRNWITVIVFFVKLHSICPLYSATIFLPADFSLFRLLFEPSNGSHIKFLHQLQCNCKHTCGRQKNTHNGHINGFVCPHCHRRRRMRNYEKRR